MSEATSRTWNCSCGIGGNEKEDSCMCDKTYAEHVQEVESAPLPTEWYCSLGCYSFCNLNLARDGSLSIRMGSMSLEDEEEEEEQKQHEQETSRGGDEKIMEVKGNWTSGPGAEVHVTFDTSTIALCGFSSKTSSEDTAAAPDERSPEVVEAQEAEAINELPMKPSHFLAAENKACKGERTGLGVIEIDIGGMAVYFEANTET